MYLAAVTGRLDDVDPRSLHLSDYGRHCAEWGPEVAAECCPLLQEVGTTHPLSDYPIYTHAHAHTHTHTPHAHAHAHSHPHTHTDNQTHTQTHTHTHTRRHRDKTQRHTHTKNTNISLVWFS